MIAVKITKKYGKKKKLTSDSNIEIVRAPIIKKISATINIFLNGPNKS